MRTVWTIAGLDPSGCAGIHTDIQTIWGLGLRACSITTALTAQNAHHVSAIEYVSAEHVANQLATLTAYTKPLAIKIGMLGASAANEVLLSFLARYDGNVVLDPVIQATSGTPLYPADLKTYLADLRRFFPFVDILTPNKMEAELLLNRSLSSYTDIEEAAHELIHLGIKNILLKGGHVKDNAFSQDYWTNGKESFWLSNKRYPIAHYRGTGCTLSSAIAAALALGHDIKDAIVIAHMYTHRGIRLAHRIDKTIAMLFHANWPEEEWDLPYLSSSPLKAEPKKFNACADLGLYPVVDSIAWLEKLLPLGVKTIQLRIKDRRAGFEKEIHNSIALAKKYKAKLFINDYWELAIHYGAENIHLGQEDLQSADLEKIHHAGLQLGISTHCYHEVARAHAIGPSYLACGPIYSTTSKIMPFSPQGLEQLKRWRRTLNYPLVAIGGINQERLPVVLATGVEGIALISAITKAQNPALATQQLLALVNTHKKTLLSAQEVSHAHS
ncbi:phosphomethylpyrimidine kinase ThiD/thiamin-phosphate pyrophosphorylase fused protein ThiE [Legionella lansingensis]|uniref:Thiamine-phosphate synthase n=1 Tax=Legionella lansingensis TaxID=45067 RepID=A0A0W0VMQ9_9GAMM|nr:thiamine phosphate synthase [Legionella lansingensis]KTD21426.1 bifunctional phosphomethylpyrimidine kinase ThiD/thiamin- phosphate pyrophosphorylase ThiE [Legionella lansingensis]SNV51980.1 phosphomethylpyrimidine kinase ThiD/thiamin-phosphate pyrophosphorylase fused protein ThiE [Legionella lansingensis]